MKSFNFKKLVAVSALGLVAVLGMSETANAQYSRSDQRQERKYEKQQEKIQRQRAKLEQERYRLQQQRIQNRQYNRNVYANGNNQNVYGNNNNRYRVYRNGAYYNTDNRGAELLRQAVNSGYQQGFNAGQSDRNGRRNSSWNNSSVYRNGTYGYQSHVDRNQYQYYFQQGFQKGYQDGYNSSYQNGQDGRYQYGSSNGGALNILGTILQQVLNIQQY